MAEGWGQRSKPLILSWKKMHHWLSGFPLGLGIGIGTFWPVCSVDLCPKSWNLWKVTEWVLIFTTFFIRLKQYVFCINMVIFQDWLGRLHLPAGRPTFQPNLMGKWPCNSSWKIHRVCSLRPWWRYSGRNRHNFASNSCKVRLEIEFVPFENWKLFWR